MMSKVVLVVSTLAIISLINSFVNCEENLVEAFQKGDCKEFADKLRSCCKACGKDAACSAKVMMKMTQCMKFPDSTPKFGVEAMKKCVAKKENHCNEVGLGTCLMGSLDDKQTSASTKWLKDNMSDLKKMCKDVTECMKDCK